MIKYKLVTIIIFLVTAFPSWSMEQQKALRLAAISTAFSRDLTAARLPEVPVLLATADQLLKRGVGQAEVRKWLIDTETIAQSARQQLKLYEYDRVALLTDSSTLIATITQQPQIKYSAELIATAKQIGAVRISSLELCKVQRCDPRVLAEAPQFTEQVRDIVRRLEDNNILRSVATDYFRKSDLSGLADMANHTANVNESLEAFANNRYVRKLLKDMPQNGKLLEQLPGRFDDVLQTYRSDVGNLIEGYTERMQRIDDLETGLQFAGHLAGLVDPKLGSTVNQIANVWTQVERARTAFNTVGNVANAFAMANSYMFAANVGISLLSGGNPLERGGGEQAMMDAMRGYFEAVFKALQEMTEYMEKRFDAIDKRLNGISKQLVDIQNRLVTIEYKIDRVAITTSTVRDSVQEIHQRINALESLIVGASQLVVDFDYKAGKHKCFREVGVNPAADTQECISLFRTYGIDHSHELFDLNSQYEGRASSFDLYLRSTANSSLASALNEPGYDLETLIEGASAYTDYTALLLVSSSGASSIIRQGILSDLQSLKSALLSRQLVYRSFLWEPVAALRITAPTEPPLAGATVAFKENSNLNSLYENLSVMHLVKDYMRLFQEIASTRPDIYSNYSYYVNSDTIRDLNIDPNVYVFCMQDDSNSLTLIARQFRHETLDQFTSLHTKSLNNKSHQIRIIRDVLLEGYKELLLTMSESMRQNLSDFVYSSVSMQGLSFQIEKFVDEIACQGYGAMEFVYRDGKTAFDSRLSNMIEGFRSLAKIEPAAVDSLQFRDRRIGPLLRRIDSIRSYIELSSG